MNLQTTKSQTIALMAAELSAIEKQCESYQLAVSKLHKQVVALTKQVRQMDQCEGGPCSCATPVGACCVSFCAFPG